MSSFESDSLLKCFKDFSPLVMIFPFFNEK
jgi:hypothetical protein